MDELGQKKSNTGLIVTVVAVLAVLVAGFYFYNKKSAVPESSMPTAETVVEDQAAPSTPTEPAVTQNEVVVPTKELDLGPKVAPVRPEITDPAVKEMMGERSIGDANAPIVIDEYASLTCGHCGAFHRDTFEAVKKEFIDSGKVKFVFHEFPLNPPAVDASMILRCMPEDKFVSFMQLLFTEQDKWAYDEQYKDKLRQNAKLAGMSDEQFDGCLANNALKEAIVGEMKYAGEAYKVASTPSFVFNKGERMLVGSQPIGEFQRVIGEISSAPKAQDESSPAAAPDATTPDITTEAPAADAPVEATPEVPVTPIAE